MSELNPRFFLFMFISPEGVVKETIPLSFADDSRALAHAELMAKNRNKSIEIWKQGKKLAIISAPGETKTAL